MKIVKDVKISSDTMALISDKELMPAVEAFKNGAAYKALMTANFTKLFRIMDINALRALVGLLEKEIISYL